MHRTTCGRLLKTIFTEIFPEEEEAGAFEAGEEIQYKSYLTQLQRYITRDSRRLRI